MKGNPVGTPSRQPEPVAPQISVTREIRHLAYRLDVADTPNGKAIIAILPGEGEVHVFDVDEDTKQRLLAGLTGGIVPASADQLPPAPTDA